MGLRPAKSHEKLSGRRLADEILWGRLVTQCRSFFPRPDTCKNRGTEIDERDHAKTRLCVERLERPALPAEIAGQKTSGIGLPTCPTKSRPPTDARSVFHEVSRAERPSQQTTRGDR